MNAMSNEQLKLGHSATNGQLSPMEPSSNGHPRSGAGVLGNIGSRSNGRRGDEQQNNGRKGDEQRSNARDESEARYCEFTRQSILSDPRLSQLFEISQQLEALADSIPSNSPLPQSSLGEGRSSILWVDDSPEATAEGGVSEPRILASPGDSFE